MIQSVVMNYNNFKTAFSNNSKKLSVYFFMLFFVFSLIISASGYIVSQYLLTSNSNIAIEQNLKMEFIEKKDIISNFVYQQHYFLNTFINNNVLMSYVKDQEKHENEIKNIFMSIANTTPDIMQLRYIDKKGFEKIRVDRNKYSDTPFFTKKEKLQNKSNRYYFKETKQLKKTESIWFSKLDLNIEYGKLQYPIVSTIRVAKPIIINNKFEGIVIVNIFAEKFIEKLTKSLHFKIAILNKKEEYIHHFDNPNKSWSEFFKERNSFSEDCNMKDKFIIDEITNAKIPFFTKNIENLIPNNKLNLIFIPNKTTQQEVSSIQKKYILYFIILTLLISIPISILLSRIPFKYTRKLINNKDNLLDIIDEHVLYSTSDLQGNITDISEAVCKLTKYTKNELLGKSHSIFRHPDTPDDAFQSMWSTIIKGNTWHGEIKNLDKDNNVFWIDATITPNFDDNAKIVGFTAIRENITDKKIIEALSITDELTTLYNKRYFNKMFTKELKSAKRINAFFVLVILDIDNFKLFNDTYGHKEGDMVLQKIGVLIQKMFKRSYDFAFRVGGEEFAIIFLENDISKIKPYIERVRKGIEDLKIPHELNNGYGVVTASLGYKVINENTNLTEDEIYTQADQGLYAAKKRGRNQIVQYEDLNKY